jgi:hypothetical protein
MHTAPGKQARRPTFLLLFLAAVAISTAVIISVSPAEAIASTEAGASTESKVPVEAKRLPNPRALSDAPVPPGLPPAGEIAFEMRYGPLPGRPTGTGDLAGNSAYAAASSRSGGRTDLQLHVLVSTALTVGGYYGSTKGIGWPHRTSLATAAGGSLAAGLLKELYDRSKIGNRFSGADMLMNAFGTGIGVGLAVGIHQ